MKYFAIMALVILCFLSHLNAIDHLETMTTLFGEFNGSWFGERVVSMDYNGDGYDDVIVHAPYWNPTGVYNSNQCWGKIYFFWGGPNMDNIPDFVMEGSENWELYPAGPFNGGDINGDGIDDLVITLPVDPACVIAVYYGTANPTGIPDLTITIPYEAMGYIVSWPLGDINGDGRDDLVIHCPLWTNPQILRLIIWTGNDAPFVTLRETTNGSVAISAVGVGDVNSDDLDDYLLQYGISGGTNMNSRIVLYYGNTNFPQVDSLVISDNTNAITIKSASPLGDVNNDGYADFESYVGKVWFGGIGLTPNNDLEFTFNYLNHEWGNPDYNVGAPFIYGDLNGDGYDDIIGSSYLINYYVGELGIWVGGPNMDGLIDLYQYPPSDYETRQYGYAKAAGDFNGDGLCDLAVSAPMYYSAPQWATGRVFIYSGNVALTDTVVANDDQVEAEPSWEINVFPNPLRANEQLKIDLLGSGYKASTPFRLELFNLRGQKVSSIEHVGEVLNGATLSMPVTNVANGLYIFRIMQNNKTMCTKKICVLK
ncbi:hypothetical protein MASR2M64_09650 [Candidatus Cloacimonadota bacterium]